MPDIMVQLAVIFAVIVVVCAVVAFFIVALAVAAVSIGVGAFAAYCGIHALADLVHAQVVARSSREDVWEETGNGSDSNAKVTFLKRWKS